MYAYENVVPGKLKFKGKTKEKSTIHLSIDKEISEAEMYAYENVVTGKLKFKGKALDVKSGGTKKKNKSMGTMAEEEINDEEKSKGGLYLDKMTPAERRYMEQRQKIDMPKMAKTSNKSHRDRLGEFTSILLPA